MPAESVAQRQLFAIAEHHPDKLHAENKGLAKMGKAKLHEWASTSESGLPKHKSRAVRRLMRRK